MKGSFASVIVGLILILASPAAARQRPTGPDALLSSGDRYRQEQTLQNALEYDRTARSTSWMNPDTGHRGRVTPLSTYKNWAGQDCRRYERSLTIDGRAAVGHGTRCRTRNGVWIVPRVVSAYRRRYYDPYYPSYYRPYYPFAIHLGYYFGGFSGHGGHWHHRHWHHRRWRH